MGGRLRLHPPLRNYWGVTSPLSPRDHRPCHWSYSQNHKQQHVNTLRAKSSARTRYVWHSTASHLPSSRCGQDAVRVQRLERIHQNDWPTASRCILHPQQEMWILPTGPAIIWRAVRKGWRAALRQDYQYWPPPPVWSPHTKNQRISGIQLEEQITQTTITTAHWILLTQIL